MNWSLHKVLFELLLVVHTILHCWGCALQACFSGIWVSAGMLHGIIYLLCLLLVH